MGGNELLTGPDLSFIDVRLKEELLSGIGLWDGIGVSSKPYPAIGVGPHFHLAVTAKLVAGGAGPSFPLPILQR